jgi:5'-nucleotidase
MDNVLIVNQEKLAIAKKNISAGGPENLQVVSDFDKTLTTCFVDGKKIISLISILRDEKYLTPDYSEKAQALFNKYHPTEIDPKISREEKVEAMYQWWTEHYDLLVKSSLSKNDLEKVVQNKKISLRAGASDFLELLKALNIPLVILSAAGLGAETIALYLQKTGHFYENIFIASNAFVWDENNRVAGVKEPIIHTFNKDYNTVKKFDFYDKVKNRKNIILLGDSLGDAEMINGFDYNNIIKIGFLNESSKGELANFKNNYDIVVLNDGSMDSIVESFKEVFDAIILNDGPLDFVNILLKEIFAIKNNK